MRPLLPLALASALAAGCGTDATVPARPAEPISLGDPRGTLPPGHPPTGMPPGHPPVDAPPPPPAERTEAGITAARFAAPEGWQPEKPAGSMRLLQYRLPRADGDPADGEVVVFPNAMGSTKANIDRWRGQFSGVAHGADRLDEIPVEGKGKVHLLDIVGKYSGGMSPTGGGPAPPAWDGETRMLAAVVEVPSGTYYVKATGPAATMGKWEKSVREFVLASAAK